MDDILSCAGQADFARIFDPVEASARLYEIANAIVEGKIECKDIVALTATA